MNVFAAFAIVRHWDGRIWATTREDGSIGLPGGKLEQGEDIIDAARREAREEGLSIRALEARVVRVAEVDGKPVAWVEFVFAEAHRLDDYKEQYRGIRPIIVPVADVAAGFGNEFLLEAA